MLEVTPMRQKAASTFITLTLVVLVAGGLQAAPADGVYSGNTGQGRAISITVTGGAITGYSISWECGSSAGTTTVGLTCSIGGDGSFSCGSSSCPGAASP